MFSQGKAKKPPTVDTGKGLEQQVVSSSVTAQGSRPISPRAKDKARFLFSFLGVVVVVGGLAWPGEGARGGAMGCRMQPRMQNAPLDFFSGLGKSSSASSLDNDGGCIPLGNLI